jgi:hypothetical protein
MVTYRTSCNKLGFTQEQTKPIQVIASIDEFRRIEEENTSLKQANSDLSNKLVLLAKGIRTEKIGNILSNVPFKTDDERQKVLQSLVNSNLSLNDIESTYQPFLTKSATIQTTTKLPQKSTLDNRNDFIK